MKFKRLYFDLEVSPNIVLSWRAGYKLNISPDDIIKERAIICVCYKWEGDKQTSSMRWNNGNDKELVTKFTKILQQADEVVGHNCVTEDTKILTERLKWIDAGKLKIGDELVGFNEGNFGPCRDKEGTWIGLKESSRKFKKSVVTGYEKKIASVYRVTFDDETFVDTTLDHSWLGMAPKDQNQRWYTTKKLLPGYRCLKPFDIWEKEQTYNSGYISGMVDADGSISKDGYYSTSIYQSSTKNADICKKIEKVLKEESIEYSIDNIETSKIISTSYKSQEKESYYVHSKSTVYRFLGTVFEKLKYIGKYRIQKGVRNFSSDNLGHVKVPANRVRTVVSNEYLGEKTIVVMQTSSKTFIGNGYLMHNCDKFDIKWFRTRCAYHGIDCPPNINSVDTLKLAKNNFLFNSNKLDYIGGYFNLGHKLKTEYSLWKDILLKNSTKAMNLMVTYCKRDVELLEQVHQKMKNYSLHKTHKAVSVNGDKIDCPECGSEKTKVQKRRISAAGTKSIQFQCSDCGKYHSVASTTAEKQLAERRRKDQI